MLAEPQEQRHHGEHGESIEDFLNNDAFIRVLCGGRGSGKTFALAEDVTAHIWQNAGGKAIIARETEASQADSSIDTFLSYYATLGPLYTPEFGLFKTWNNGRSIRLPSRLAIEALQRDKPKRAELSAWVESTGDALCGYVEFRGLPAAEKGKFRGMECSYLALVEADQIARWQFDLSLACLRWKGADPATCDDKGFITDRCVVLDTNPPGPQHWIAQLEAEEEKKPEHERVMRFWHIPTNENEHNLPENYIRDTILLPYANNPPMLERMLYGRYADAFDGKPVYYAYRRDAHESEKLGWPRGATLVVGMDVGTNNASVINAFKVHHKRLYWWTLRELILTGSDTDRQCIELLKILANEFPFWNTPGEVCAQTLFFCDPAARNSAFTAAGPTSSALKVMHSHGIFPGMKVAQHLQPTIAAVNRLLQQNHTETNGGSIWHFKIDVNRCPTTTRGLRGQYRYPSKDEPGFGNDQPLKGSLCEHVDHCFVAGTMIETDIGSVPIERVRAGMRVLTRQGWRVVTGSGKTGFDVEVWTMRAGHYALTGTAGHPIWTEESGWKPLAHLMQCDTMITCEPNAWNTKARFTADIPNQSGAQIVSISRITSPIFITKSGEITADQFQKGATSTTTTKTQETTRSETSFCARQKNMPPTTGQQSEQRRLGEDYSNRIISPPSGTEAKRASNGTDHTQNNSSLEHSPAPRDSATTADLTTQSSDQLASCHSRDSVPINASQPPGEKQEPTTRIANASNAEILSESITTARRKIAVESVERSGVAEVYNLTVEGVHEYFANGILVHNCMDSLRYAIINVLDIATEDHQGGMRSNYPEIGNPEPSRRI